MPRPLRLEFPSAQYQLTSRDDIREDIYPDEIAQIICLLCPSICSPVMHCHKNFKKASSFCHTR